MVLTAWVSMVLTGFFYGVDGNYFNGVLMALISIILIVLTGFFNGC